MNHIEVTVECADERRREILLAELADFPFESFCEEADCLKAYIREADYRRTVARIDGYLKKTGYRYRSETIEDRNWNELWESNFEPIDIEGKCRIRAPFHPKNPAAEYELVIMPKMAFGTGNHETTYLMISKMLKLDLEGKELLDMGCGTAVLAILARLKGAKRVAAIDIDEWAYNNALENIRLNHTEDIQVALGGAEKIKEFGLFDIVFANINRNILLNDICQYTNSMKPGSLLFMSGFYVEDIPALEAECQKNGLKLDSYNERNNWVAVKVLKG
mgnify:CR=1 FL=1